MKIVWNKVNTYNPVTPPAGKKLLLYREGGYFEGKYCPQPGFTIGISFIETNSFVSPHYWADVFYTGTKEEFDQLRPHMTPENEPDGWTCNYFKRKAEKQK
jgi:hypothetical protein